MPQIIIQPDIEVNKFLEEKADILKINKADLVIEIIKEHFNLKGLVDLEIKEEVKWFMANIKKTLMWIGIWTAIIVGLIIILLIINTVSAKCDLPAHQEVYAYYNQTRDIIQIVPEQQRLNDTGLLESKYCYYNLFQLDYFIYIYFLINTN